MNYYKEIKNKLIDDEIYSRVKDYSKEKWSCKINVDIKKVSAFFVIIK